MGGPFSKMDILSWISQCLPDVPTNSGDEEAVLYFKSTLIDTHLICRFSKGSASFKSDSPSSLIIIKVQ